MKRLFGLIGFTFLFVLSAVFYSDFNEIVFAIIGSLGVLSVAVGIFLIISKKNKSFGKSLCVFAFAVIYSAGNMITYSEYINNTIINIPIKKLQQADIFVMKSSPPIHHAVS